MPYRQLLLKLELNISQQIGVYKKGFYDSLSLKFNEYNI
jgi:hypothetical protein